MCWREGVAAESVECGVWRVLSLLSLSMGSANVYSVECGVCVECRVWSVECGECGVWRV